MRVDNRIVNYDSAANSRTWSRVHNTALRMWKQEHPAEWAEAWPVVRTLVANCYPPGTPNARHGNALNVMRSALAKEHPEQWSATLQRAKATVAA